MTTQSNNNNLNYLTDPTFTKVNRLFVLPFARIPRENNTPKDRIDSFSYNYVPNVEIKVCNVLVDGKSFWTCRSKMWKKLMRKLFRSVEIMTTQLVIYWILFISKRITN